MSRLKSKAIKKILLAFLLVLFDIAVYFILSMLLMNYDDFYNESMGPYWSLQSMTFWQKVNFIGLSIWNILNSVAILFVLYKITIGYLARRSMNQ